jgi:sortase A
MKRKVLTVVSVLAFVIGVCILLYPSFVKEINLSKTDSVVDEFDAKFELIYGENADENSDKTDTGNSKNKKKKTKNKDTKTLTPEQLEMMYEDFSKYNKELYEGNKSADVNPFVYEDAALDLTKYGIDDGVVGYVSAPSIDMKLPIYLGASEYNMLQGATHMNRTSLPIGGENTNCTLAGHRGLISAVMFDNIVYLAIGDDVYIKNYFGQLHYKVSEIKIVTPNDCANSFLIKEGKDLLTMFTCHPYGSNAQRYLVICERVE